MVNLFITLVIMLLSLEVFSIENRVRNIDGIEQINGVLKISIIDDQRGTTTPARVEVVGDKGQYHIASDALPIGGDCGDFQSGSSWKPKKYDDSTLLTAVSKFQTTIEAPFTEATHFYTTGTATLVLSPGVYKGKIFKGPEYYVKDFQAEVAAGQTVHKAIKINRFANMPANDWYSADDHLHIARIHKDVNPLILQMMKAEDIHVGNLLQMGRADTFETTPQYAHGKEAIYQEENYLIASGQENLRTHLLGHTITLGASKPIYDKKNYLLYHKAWEEGVDLGGINGYAHYGQARRDLGPDPGLPLVAPHNLMHFIEVLQFNKGHYKTWYDMLNLGFRITPTAGSDFPCASPRLPGQERFYTKVNGQFNYENWLESVRKGKTFVTTGPLVDFKINGQDVGSEIFIEGNQTVTISGKVVFPNTENHLGAVRGLELIANGEVIKRFPRLDDTGNIHFELKHIVKESSWYALRTSGIINLYPSKIPYSTAHTAPIYVTLNGAPPISSHDRAKPIAKNWISSIRSLEARLLEGGFDYTKHTKSISDPVPHVLLNDNKNALHAQINEAIYFFESYLD